MNPAIDSMYDGFDARDVEIFRALDKAWFVPCGRFTHGEWQKIFDIPKGEYSGDGSPCAIFECRMPARFFKLEVYDSKNSIGEPSAGFSLSTGSGDDMGKLISQIAIAVRRGMLGWEGKSLVPRLVDALRECAKQDREGFAAEEKAAELLREIDAS